MDDLNPVPGRAPAETHCKACATFARAIEELQTAAVPFLVGGGFAVEVYLDAPRARIKDLDLFLRPVDVGAALKVLNKAGFKTKLHEPGWIAKAFDGEEFIDLIFATRNELLTVDDESFVGAPDSEVLGRTVKLQPVEELIATKLFVAARDRFDVADIAHLLLKRGAQLDWARLVARVGPHVEMLHVHLLLFQYVYPGRRDVVPRAVLEDVERRARAARAGRMPEAASRGLALDPIAFAVDIERWGFFDARRTERLATPGGETDASRASADQSGAFAARREPPSERAAYEVDEEPERANARVRTGRTDSGV